MGSSPDNEGTRRKTPKEDESCVHSTESNQRESEATRGDSANRTSSRADHPAEQSRYDPEPIGEPLQPRKPHLPEDYETWLQGIPPERLKEYTDQDLLREYTCRVRGSVAEIEQFLHTLSDIRYSNEGVFPYIVPEADLKKTTPLRKDWYIQSAIIGPGHEGILERKTYGRGFITKIPGTDSCHVHIRSLQDRYLPHLRYWWDRLYAELQSAGLIVDMQQMAGSTEGIERPKDIPATKVGGHKGLACNKWAYNEYYEKRRSAGEILPEWVSRWEQEMDKSIDELADPRQSMMSAIRYRRKKLLARENS